MNALWVRNEWMRYLDMMDEEENTKTLIPVYSKMDPYDIPQEISGRHLQAQDAGKIGFQQDLLHGISDCLITGNPLSNTHSPFHLPTSHL